MNQLVWMPPLTWGIGYFFGGGAADRYTSTNQRSVGMFLLLTAVSLTLGFTPATTSVGVAMAIISLSTFIDERVSDAAAQSRIVRLSARRSTLTRSPFRCALP